MKPVIVLSVSAWGAVFIFLRSRSTSLSPVICFVIVFPFRAVVRSKSAKISSWLCSAHPAEALAQLLCEKSRLLEGGEWSPFFSSLSPLRRAFGRRLLQRRTPRPTSGQARPRRRRDRKSTRLNSSHVAIS